MEKKKDPMDRIILEDIQMEAEMIKKEVQEADVGAMPPEVKDRIRERLHAKMAENDREAVYDKLSEEDRKALELGRELLKKQEADKREEKVVRYRRPKKVYIAMAAVLIMVLGMGVTSVGGPKRVVQMMQAVIGEREIVRVDTEDNYVVKKDAEDAAYERLEEVFGVKPVKPGYWPEGTVFVVSEIDEELQTALLIYEYQGNRINYYLSSHHTNSSWGIDTEDKVADEYYVKHAEKGKLKITEYESSQSGVKSCSVTYTHNGVEYLLEGALERSEFEYLVENLKFF